MSASPSFEQDRVAVEKLADASDKIRSELSKAIIGQTEVIDQLLIALFSGGHCLLTGAPGLAKTLLVSSIAEVFSLKFSRIQFTPDLMPADIVGTEILQETEGGGRALKFVKGPVFANILLADEINRTPPKTQAALLEAMQEKQVTAAGKRYDLDKPFFVLATQNPIEMDGTYPLPEAQLDRFMFNIWVDYLSEEDEVKVITKTTGKDDFQLETLFSAEDVRSFHDIVRKVPVAEDVARFAVRLATLSRPNGKESPDFINNWVSWGAGLRTGQFLVLGGKARALLHGRAHVIEEDIRALAEPVMRHRVLLNYRAEADGMTVEGVIKKLLEVVK
ncbi:MAG: MoxR-like ATPase [Verrucomicrobiales bacterium]|jgi:MoxR-like ATPase